MYSVYSVMVIKKRNKKTADQIRFVHELLFFSFKVKNHSFCICQQVTKMIRFWWHSYDFVCTIQCTLCAHRLILLHVIPFYNAMIYTVQCVWSCRSDVEWKSKQRNDDSWFLSFKVYYLINDEILPKKEISHIIWKWDDASIISRTFENQLTYITGFGVILISMNIARVLTV